MTTPGTEESRAKARKLIDAIRQRSEPVNVDLGCGFRKKGNVGIDVTPHGTEADIICRIGFEPIPLDDEVADTVYCRDFLEHIPKAYYSEHDRILRYPVIEVMNEVWRILSRRNFHKLHPLLSCSRSSSGPHAPQCLDT